MDPRVFAAVAIVGALAVWGGWYLARAWKLWARLRGDRIVTCPETGLPAAVHIDLALAITGDEGAEPVTLDGCSRWCDRGRCEQPCARAAQSPASSAAAMVRSWANGRSCVSCGGALAEGRGGHHLALFEPGGASREWVDVAAEKLPLALDTSLPM